MLSHHTLTSSCGSDLCIASKDKPEMCWSKFKSMQYSGCRAVKLVPGDCYWKCKVFENRNLLWIHGCSVWFFPPQVWSVAVMLLSRKFCRVPHMFTVNLFVAQVSQHNANVIQKLVWNCTQNVSQFSFCLCVLCAVIGVCGYDIMELCGEGRELPGSRLELYTTILFSLQHLCLAGWVMRTSPISLQKKKN